MKLYRFSPINSKDELNEAINYLNKTSFELCFKILGKKLPVAGNLGIFPHYDEEYHLLKNIQNEITLPPDKYNDKYLVLKEPFKFPEAKYSYFYVRRVDPYRHHVGDIDFYLEKREFDKLKKKCDLNMIKGARYLERLDMIELFDPDFDVLVYISHIMWETRIENKRK